MRDTTDHNAGEIVYRTFDPDETRATTAILDALAEIEDLDPMEATPLAKRVDPDAIDALIDSGAGVSPVSVAFEYEGFEVRVAGDGTVEITETSGRATIDTGVCSGGTGERTD